MASGLEGLFLTTQAHTIGRGHLNCSHDLRASVFTIFSRVETGLRDSHAG